MKKDRNSFFASEKNLFLRLKKYKDEEAFIAAYDKYVDDIYRFIYFKIGSEAEAQDLTSSVFIKCWSYVKDGKLDSSNDYKSLRSFLYKIARNATIDYYRQQKPNQNIESVALTMPDSRQDQAHQLEIDERMAELYSNLNKLKSDYRGLIIMRHVNGLSIAEIADILDKSKGSVRVSLHRAMKALKDLYKNEDDR